MKKLYQVILSNCAERMPINETVVANNENHALNFVLKKHKAHIDNFNVVFIQTVDNVADEYLDHNDYEYKFVDNILTTHKQPKIDDRFKIEIEIDGEIVYFDKSIAELIQHHLALDLKKTYNIKT